MRRVSLNARKAFDDFATDEVEVVLIQIEHPGLDKPVRLSTDPTERLSTEPLFYGTRSTWMGANPVVDPFLFVLASADVPGDQEDVPSAATIVIENASYQVAEQLRGFIDRPTVHMAVVLKSSPDLVELEFRNMVMVSAEGNAGEITISVTRQPIEDETVPMDRFTRDRFPGLFR